MLVCEQSSRSSCPSIQDPQLNVYSHIMPPTVAVPRDHGSTLPGRGNTIVAIIISVILAIVAIGWLIYCWYTRHVGIGVMVSQAHARMARDRPQTARDAEAGHAYVDVYTPRYTYNGWMRAKRKRRLPSIEEPRRVWVHRVPADEGRYRLVRQVIPQHQEMVNVLPDNSPPAKKQKKNQQQHPQQQNKNKGKKKQKNKKNRPLNKQQDHQRDPTNVEEWQDHEEHPSNQNQHGQQAEQKSWWNNQSQADQGQAEQNASGQRQWSEKGEHHQSNNDQGQMNDQNNQLEQKQVKSPGSQWGNPSQGGRKSNNGRTSSKKSNSKRSAKEVMSDQLGLQQPSW